MMRPSVVGRVSRVAQLLRARPDATIMLGLALLTVAVRLPFQCRFLYHWDSVNFAYGLERFDVAAAQPQMPGYILYVALGQAVNALVGDHQTTLVTISIVASGLAVALLYALGREMFGRATGLVAAVFLAASPLFWFYGEIALPHTLDTLMVILSAWLLYRIMKGDHHLIWVTAVALGIAGGLRPWTLAFLGPLIVLAGRKVALKRAVGGIVALGMVCLAWFIPLMVTIGGLGRYMMVFQAYSGSFTATSSLFSAAGTFGLGRNLRKLIMYTLYAWAAAVLPAMAYAALRLRRPRLAGLLRSERSWFLVVWVAPALVFYIIVHMGQQGLVFVYLPALLLLSAEGLRRLAAGRVKALAVSVTALAIGSGALFLVAPTYPLGPDNFKMLTRETIRQQDDSYQARLSAIQDNFSPEHSVVLANDWRHVQYYLPQYALVQYDIVPAWEVGAGEPDPRQETQRLTAQNAGATLDQEGEVTVVVFDLEVVRFFTPADALSTLNLSQGRVLHYLTLGAGEALQIGPEGIRLVSGE